jgi:hypothetical protein
MDFRVTPAGSPIKRPSSKLIFHPFASNNPSNNLNPMKIGGDKTRQKEAANAKEKENSTMLNQVLKHIFDSPITESMRVFKEGDASKQAGIISIPSSHTGDWFQPRSPEDFTISLGREIPDSSSSVSTPSTASRKIVSIDKLLDKGEKTLRRNGSVLVCGGRGAGKSAALNELSKRMNTHLTRIPPLKANISNVRCCPCPLRSNRR